MEQIKDIISSSIRVKQEVLENDELLATVKECIAVIVKVLKVSAVLNFDLVDQNEVSWALFGIEILRALGDEIDEGVPYDSGIANRLGFFYHSLGHCDDRLIGKWRID